MQDQEQGLPTEILVTLKELGDSLVNHGNWTRNLHRTLLCNEGAHENDLTDDAHRRCLFGQWYYSTDNSKLLALPGFQEVGELHQGVHENARRLLSAKRDSNEITTAMYDNFIDVVHSFRAAVQDLQYSIISEVCTIDHLTGVWNRYTMSHRLQQESERSRRTGKPSAIAIMDFDHFKNINDKHGHLCGDIVLRNVVEFIARQFRKYDAIFRYGGEEFLFLFPETSIEDATGILERLRKDVRNVATKTAEGHEIYVTVSIGLTILNETKTDNEAIAHADRALLFAKANGRDRLEVWP